MLKTGKIIKIISNLYTVEVDGELYNASARGKFRNLKLTPLVGDIVKIDTENQYILEILPRKNYLERPMIANVDCALIVVSVKSPDLSLHLLDKMLSVITIHEITPILCFSKLDLLDRKEMQEIKKIMKYYKSLGYQVVTNQNILKIKSILKHKMVVITGQTGAGKSSLLNKLDKHLQLKTNEISKALGRGKHTTRHVELFTFKNFYIADTPGFSALDFQNIKKEEIRDSFIEFKNYTCKFHDCMHKGEIGCGVAIGLEKKEILKSRYDNYRSFLEK